MRACLVLDVSARPADDHLEAIRPAVELRRRRRSEGEIGRRLDGHNKAAHHQHVCAHPAIVRTQIKRKARSSARPLPAAIENRRNHLPNRCLNKLVVERHKCATGCTCPIQVALAWRRFHHQLKRFKGWPSRQRIRSSIKRGIPTRWPLASHAVPRSLAFGVKWSILPIDSHYPRRWEDLLPSSVGIDHICTRDRQSNSATRVARCGSREKPRNTSPIARRAP